MRGQRQSCGRRWNGCAEFRGLSVSDFGTRRRHSFLVAGICCQGHEQRAGRGFKGTSNTYLAYKHDLEAIGTNAHELPMALAAMANDDAELKASQYRLLELWQQTYQGELLILLPDTFGTTQFLRQCTGLDGGLDGPARRQQRSLPGG